MDPVTKALLSSWNWRVDVIIIILSAGTLFCVGWFRLRGRSKRLAAVWRLAAYLGGLVLVGLSLLSPIDVLGGQFFFMHMIQHLLLIMFAPPLLLVGNPMPFILWGLPTPLRRRAGKGLSYVLHRQSRFRQAIIAITAPGIVWMVFVSLLIGWHDANAYNAALSREWVHNLEHLSFFIPSMAFWWLVTGAGPRLQKQMSLFARVGFVLSAVPPNMFLGIALSFATHPIYTHYLSVPRLGTLSVLEDQMIGGVIMWVPGSMMYIIAAVILIGSWFSKEEKKPQLYMSSVRENS